MLRINLLPPALRPKLIINLDLIFIVFLCVAGGTVAFSFLNVQTKLKKTQSELARLQNESTEQKSLIEQLRAKENTRDMSATQALVAKRKKWNSFIKELTYIMPPDVWMTHMTVTNDKDVVALQFTGMAPSQKSVNRLLGRMERAVSFQSVKLNSSKAKTDYVPSLYAFDFSVNDIFQSATRAPASQEVKK